MKTKKEKMLAISLPVLFTGSYCVLISLTSEVIPNTSGISINNEFLILMVFAVTMAFYFVIQKTQKQINDQCVPLKLAKKDRLFK